MRCVQKVFSYWKLKAKYASQDNSALVAFQIVLLLFMGLQTIIPAFLPLFKTVHKILFRDYHQLPHLVCLNLIQSVPKAIKVLVKDRGYRATKVETLLVEG